MEKALKGDTKAFEVLRDTAGQKPVEKVEQINIDAEYENKRFKCSDEVVEYSDGQKYLTKCSATYPDSCFIALPNGWEEHLNK